MESTSRGKLLLGAWRPGSAGRTFALGLARTVKVEDTPFCKPIAQIVSEMIACMGGRRKEAIALLARLCGITPQTYRNWQREQLVDGPRSEHPTELDAVEAAAVAELMRELKGDGRSAWKQVRQVLMGMVPGPSVRVVWREAAFEAVLCRSDQAVGRAISVDTRSARVVFVGEAVRQALDGLGRRNLGSRRSGRKVTTERQPVSR